jgi:transcriptional regulator with XRE-family HTH domain
MPAKKSKKKSNLSYLRQAIGLTQRELAGLLGIAADTLQSYELQRLSLPEKVAFKIEQQTGVPARWILGEVSDPSLTATEMRRKFDKTQAHPWGTPYMARLLPRMHFFRLYIIAREVANELGGPGTPQYPEFVDALIRLNKALLESLPDVQSRRRVYQRATAILNKGPRKVCRLVASDALDTGKAMEENKAKSEAAQKWMTEHTLEEKMALAREHMAAHKRSRLYARQKPDK